MTAVKHPVVAYQETRRPAARLLRAACWSAAAATLLVLLLARPGVLGIGALLLALGGFLWWCRSTRYEVRVSDEQLELRFAPLRARVVPVEQVIGCAPHMAYPWGDEPRGRRRADGVETWRAGRGAGLVVELDGGDALWVDCGHPERLAAALRRRRRRRG